MGLTKLEKQTLYKVYKKGLERAYPNLTNPATNESEVSVIAKAEIAKVVSAMKGGTLPEDKDTLKELADSIIANAGNLVTLEQVTLLIESAISEVRGGVDETLNTLKKIDEAYSPQISQDQMDAIFYV